MVWSKEKETRLAELADEGLTAAEISARLSTHTDVVTRNAVIGKLRRLGINLSGAYMQTRSPASRARDFISRKRMERERLAKASAARPTSVKLLERKSKELLFKPFIPDEDNSKRGVYGILDIPNFKCRYPISPEGAPLRFCGRAFDVNERQWWCNEHKEVVFMKKNVMHTTCENKGLQKTKF